MNRDSAIAVSLLLEARFLTARKKTVVVFVLGLVSIALLFMFCVTQIICNSAFGGINIFTDIFSFFRKSAIYFAALIAMMKFINVDGISPVAGRGSRLTRFVNCLTGAKWRIAVSVVFFVCAGVMLVYSASSFIANVLNYRDYKSVYFFYDYQEKNRTFDILNYISVSLFGYTSHVVLYVAIALTLLPSKAKPVSEILKAPDDITAEPNPSEIPPSHD